MNEERRRMRTKWEAQEAAKQRSEKRSCQRVIPQTKVIREGEKEISDFGYRERERETEGGFEVGDLRTVKHAFFFFFFFLEAVVVTRQ